MAAYSGLSAEDELVFYLGNEQVQELAHKCDDVCAGCDDARPPCISNAREGR